MEVTVRGDGDVAGEERVVGVPKFHSWDKCSMQQSESSESDDTNMILSVTRLLENQRLMMAAQVQAMGVPPLRKFSGENIGSVEGSIDRWIEQFEERAKVMGWNDEQKLFQLKAKLEHMIVPSS